MTLFRFDFDEQKFYGISHRSGGSEKLKWKQLDLIDSEVYLKDVSFGVCEHPFDPEKTSFRRKTFTPYQQGDYGIAIKGTVITAQQYKELMQIDRSKVNSLINRLFFRHGERLWQSYPNLVKTHKEQGKWDLVRANPSNSMDTYSCESARKFPTFYDQTNDINYYYQPSPIKSLRILGTRNHWQVFNEGATVRTWHEHHDNISQVWRETVVSRRTAQLQSLPG